MASYVCQRLAGKDYNVMNGMCFHLDTPVKVMELLSDNCGGRKKRIRIFYGDNKTGRDWCEEYNVMGYIGRSTGEVKIPLLIANRNSSGGPGILDHCIVKMTIDKEIVYRHPKYNLDVKVDGNKVYTNGELRATFPNETKALAYKEFLEGKRNAK